MEQHIIIQPVAGNRIIHVIVFVCIPVLTELFRAKDKHGFIAVFVIFYNGKCRESFTKPYVNTLKSVMKYINSGEFLL